MSSFTENGASRLWTDTSKDIILNERSKSQKIIYYFMIPFTQIKNKWKVNYFLLLFRKTLDHNEHKIIYKVSWGGTGLHRKTPEGFWDVVMLCFSAWVINSVMFILLPKLYTYVVIYSSLFCCI